MTIPAARFFIKNLIVLLYIQSHGSLAKLLLAGSNARLNDLSGRQII
jgi:hypothetical protein